MDTTNTQGPGLEVFRLQTGTEPGPFLAPHLRPIQGLWSVLRRPVFAAGTWTGLHGTETYTERDLAYYEAIFPLVVGQARPWITLNHLPKARLAALMEMADGQRSGPEPLAAVLGTVAALYRNTVPYVLPTGERYEPGQMLLSDWVNVPGEVRRAIERRNFPRPSVGFEESFELKLPVTAEVEIPLPDGSAIPAGTLLPAGTVLPSILQHISLEGAEGEAVYTLPDLDRQYGRPAQLQAAQFFARESRAAAARPGRCRIVTFARGDETMAFTPEEEARIKSLESALAQIMDGFSQMNQKLDACVAQLGASGGGEMGKGQQPAPAQAQFAAGAETAVQTEVQAPAAEPAQPAAPAAATTVETDTPASAVTDERIQQLEAELAERDAKLASLESKVVGILDKQDQEVKKHRRGEIKAFVEARSNSPTSRIPGTLVPLAEHVLEQAAEADAAAGSKLKQFSRDGQQLGLLEATKALVDGMARAGAVFARGGLTQSDLPPDVDLHSEASGEWTKDSVAKEVKAFARRHKIKEPEAFKQLSRLHGQGFIRGLSRDARR